MIDWLKLRTLFTAQGRIPGDRICIFTPDGELKWEKIKALEVEGSYSSKLRVYACPVNACLVIDGNPAKYFQGHNVFGTDDIHALTRATVNHVLERLEFDITDHDRRFIDDGFIEIHRADITHSFDVGNLANARAVVRAIAEKGTLHHRGRGQLCEEGTVYFGKRSRRSAIKVYAKGHELRSHSIPSTVPFADDIHLAAQSLVRVELVLRTMEIKDRALYLLANWRQNTVAELFAEFFGKLSVPDNIELPLPTLESLSPRLRLAYDSWMRGTDLRATLPPRTFYRYRKAMLEAGVDILTVRPSVATNVTPMLRILELKPVGVPEWAVGTPAYFDPSRRAA